MDGSQKQLNCWKSKMHVAKPSELLEEVFANSYCVKC